MDRMELHHVITDPCRPQVFESIAKVLKKHLQVKEKSIFVHAKKSKPDHSGFFGIQQSRFWVEISEKRRKTLRGKDGKKTQATCRVSPHNQGTSSVPHSAPLNIISRPGITI